MARGTNEWTLQMGNIVFWICSIVSIVLFLIIGLFCFRDMSKKDIAKSATLLVLYYSVMVALQQVLIAVGLYPLMLFMVLLVPVNMYGVISGSDYEIH